MFLYGLITDAPMSFPTLFIRSLVKVQSSSAKSHGLFFPIFIHRILLDLGLDDFPASEPVHIITPIGATFLRQRATHLKASSKCPCVESSTYDPSVEAYVDPTAVVDPPLSTLSASSMCTMLDTIMTIQVVHGQLLLDLLNDVAPLQCVFSYMIYVFLFYVL